MVDLTLVAVTGTDIETTKIALEKCQSLMHFTKVMFIADAGINTYYKYNDFVFRELGPYVETSHCLLIQYDSWILRPELWDDAWLEYDYIGAPWPIKDNAYLSNGEHVRVGNGGFSLRSKRLLELPKKYNIELTQEQGYYNEDGNICCYHRKEFLDLGIKYAPIEVACVFSHELDIPENQNILPFGFHRFQK
jgi:hypothetical protein